MNDIHNSCPECSNLRSLLNEKISEIKKLQSQIEDLNKVLEHCKTKPCQICDVNKENPNVQKHEMCCLKANLVQLIRDPILSNEYEPESSELLAWKQNISTQRNSNNMKNSKEIGSTEECNSISIGEAKSSEEYIYDENYKMFYCVSTGYYYDRNSGLYYVPQNGAYYTYDYSKNAYVLYSGNDIVDEQISKEDTQQELNTLVKGTNNLQENEEEFDCNKADESCESVVFQVNNLNINDTVVDNNMVNELKTFEDNKSSNMQETESESDFQEIDQTCKSSTTDWQTPAGTNLTVQDLVREVAEQYCGMSDYIYDANTQMYYSPSTGYYYDAAKNLLYDPQSGIYYKYDQESASYEFYQQLNLTHVAEYEAVKKKTEVQDNGKSRRRYWRKKQDHVLYKDSKSPTEQTENSLEEGDLENENYSSPEEGELFSSDSDEEIENQSFLSPSTESTSAVCSPCIRAIVKNSEKLKIGTLILITCTGAIIGRDEFNAVYIPDVQVSKAHAEVLFNEEIWKYSIKDLGSQNGTFVNDARLSEPKEESQPHILNHGDKISIGSCQLMFHIHVGYETCDDCEPGQIMAELSAQEEKSISVFKTKEEKEKERRQAVRRLKKKYGLEGMSYEENKRCVSSSKYEDKAEVRRKTVGSENPYEKTKSSSIERSIEESNKGYQMLKKLGWKEGDLLGANGIGISEPIPLRAWSSKAGLGSSEEQQANAKVLPQDKRNRKWIKAQERFFQLS